MNGILLIDKPAGMTSHDVVGKVRKICGTRQVGHTGTLDPMATGLLTVLVGRAVKACEYVISDRKRYEAVLRLGVETDTDDITGKITEKSENIPLPDEVTGVIPSFTGEIMQLPPMYSALKVNGVKLCDAARRGEEIEREERPVTIYSLDCVKTFNKAEYRLTVECSGGTYIRTLCHDIGRALGCFGTMAALRRTSACGFDISEALPLAELENMTAEEIESRLIPIERFFCGLEIITLPQFYEKLCKNGCPIYLKKLGIEDENRDGTLARLYGAEGFFAVGKFGRDENGAYVKADKRFDINNC